jgi:hypothetical protein
MPSPGGGTNPDHYIYVSNKFQVKPGAKISNDLFVGPGLGVGLQVRDFAQLLGSLRCMVLYGLAKPCEGQQLPQIVYPQQNALHEPEQIGCRGECFCYKMHRHAQTPTKC